MEEALRSKTFRDDLYYRLSVIRIHVPPLRERKEDIPRLCEYFINKMARDRSVRLADNELNKLLEYEWPGNVRELRNVIERSLIIQRGQLLRPSQLLRINYGSIYTNQESNDITRRKIISLADMERKCIDDALTKFEGNYSQTAKALRISLSTLKRKVKLYGLAASCSFKK
jgi:transcriptional regulator with PAS, ATPase and Fis domain